MTLISSNKHIDVLTFRTIFVSVCLSIVFVYTFYSGSLPWLCFEYALFTVIRLNLGSYLVTSFWPKANIQSKNKAVLITGCDSGFGFLLAKRLAGAGFLVFAGCLDPESNGGPDLRRDESGRVLPFKLDVTKTEDVAIAVQFVVENLDGNDLWAVVNNAGINKGSEIAVTPISKIRDVIEVNLMGVIAVTKAFLPALIQSRGRIVTVASASGRLVTPGFVSYSVSKHAAIAFSEGLRVEVHKFGVTVVTVEPWVYKTRLADTASMSKIIRKQWSEGEFDLLSACASDYVTQLQCNTRCVFDWLANPDVHEVIDDMEAAITSEQPKYHYRPGRWYFNVGLTIINSLPKQVADYIICHYVFSSHSLILSD